MRLVIVVALGLTGMVGGVVLAFTILRLTFRFRITERGIELQYLARPVSCIPFEDVEEVRLTQSLWEKIRRGIPESFAPVVIRQGRIRKQEGVFLRLRAGFRRPFRGVGYRRALVIFPEDPVQFIQSVEEGVHGLSGGPLRVTEMDSTRLSGANEVSQRLRLDRSLLVTAIVAWILYGALSASVLLRIRVPRLFDTSSSFALATLIFLVCPTLILTVRRQLTLARASALLTWALVMLLWFPSGIGVAIDRTLAQVALVIAGCIIQFIAVTVKASGALGRWEEYLRWGVRLVPAALLIIVILATGGFSRSGVALILVVGLVLVPAVVLEMVGWFQYRKRVGHET